MNKKFLYVFVAIIALTAMLLAGCSALSTTSTMTSTAQPSATSAMTGTSQPSGIATTTPTAQPSASAASTGTTVPTTTSTTQPTATEPSATTQPTSTTQYGSVAVLVTSAAADNVNSIMLTLTAVQIQAAGNSTMTPTASTTAPATSATPAASTTPAPSTTAATSTTVANSTTSTTSTTTATSTPAGNENRWISLAVCGTTAFDLVQADGQQKMLAFGNLPPGQYNQIRIVVSKVQVPDTAGELQDATLPNQIINITQPFTVTAGKTTIIVLDFNAAQSIDFTNDNETASFDPMITPSIAN